MRVVGRAGIVAALACAALACAALALAGCTAPSPSPSRPPSQTAWSEEPSGTPRPSGSPSAFVPGGTAEQNRGAFDTAIDGVLKANADADGGKVVAALTAAGFDTGAMQVSASKTSADLQPGSISVAVELGSECLIGQWGGAVDGYRSSIVPVLGSGGCLVGGTAPVG